MFGKNLVRIFTYHTFGPKERGKMTYKNILVSGKSLSEYTNACTHARTHPMDVIRLTCLPLTTTRKELAGLTTSQEYGRILLQAHN